MSRYKKIKFIDLRKFCDQHLPNKRDNLFSAFIKVVFIFVIAGIISSVVYFGVYYKNYRSELNIIKEDRNIFYGNSIGNANTKLLKQNGDYKAWIRLKGTNLDNPIYKTDNNSFYINHNSVKKKSRYGSLFFDSACELSDKNSVIYGNNAEYGLMFGTLERLREISFYKKNSVIEFTEDTIETNFIIYAVFVLNSKEEQDNGNIYDIYKTKFETQEDFDAWIDDARQRSVVETNVSVGLNDKIITLVTDCEDFEDARLVVMARSQRNGEDLYTTQDMACLNKTPKFPKIWYDKRNIKYPF